MSSVGLFIAHPEKFRQGIRRIGAEWHTALLQKERDPSVRFCFVAQHSRPIVIPQLNSPHDAYCTSRLDFEANPGSKRPARSSWKHRKASGTTQKSRFVPKSPNRKAHYRFNHSPCQKIWRKRNSKQLSGARRAPGVPPDALHRCRSEPGWAELVERGTLDGTGEPTDLRAGESISVAVRGSSARLIR